MTEVRGKVALAYLGCKVNQAEIEELTAAFHQAGYSVAGPDDADIYVLNTCTITHVADRKARLLIHQVKRRNPRARVVVTGCYASVDPDAVRAITGVDLVVSNADKRRLVDIVAQVWPSSRAEGASEPAPARTRTMLKVEDGCQHFCTYCIVPKARGPVRSVPIPEVVEQVQRRLADGYKEIVLTGVALGSYGLDWGGPPDGSELCRLVETILRQTAVPRLRLSSVEPETVHPALFDLLSDRRLCPHLHLPLQSGCDVTLKRMGRRYRIAQYAALVDRARAVSPDIAITTDVMVGFPGETDEEFEQSRTFAEAMGFAKMHVFRFSARRGTPATRLPNLVSEAVKKERAAIMLALSTAGARAFRQRFLGTSRDVLWEEQVQPTWAAETLWTGLTDNYIRVYARGTPVLHNTITSTLLQTEADDGLYGLPSNQDPALPRSCADPPAGGGHE